MRRKRHLKVETFPFLAVLLGAMGALILVLLVFDRRAKIVARAKATQAIAQSQAKEERRLADMHTEWLRKCQELHLRLEQEESEVRHRLQAAQAQIETGLADLKSEAERERWLQAQLQAERTALAMLELDLAAGRVRDSNSDQQTTRSREEAARLAAELAQLERALEQMKAAGRQAQQTYSVVPYKGKHGDNRRPIYVECASAGVVFHPDGLALTGSDFSRTDLRSEVEKRIGKQSPLGPTGRAEETAYLLLLVRPNGVMTYYHTMESLKGLPIAFGYELIDADWTLDFPKNESDAPGQPWMVGGRSPLPAALATPLPGGTRQGRPRGVAFGPGRSEGDGTGTRPSRPGGIGTMARVGGWTESPPGLSGAASSTPYLVPGVPGTRAGPGFPRGTGERVNTGPPGNGQGTQAPGQGPPGDRQGVGIASVGNPAAPATVGGQSPTGTAAASGGVAASGDGNTGGPNGAPLGSVQGTGTGEPGSGRASGPGTDEGPAAEAGSIFRVATRATERPGLGGAAGATPATGFEDGEHAGTAGQANGTTAGQESRGPRGAGAAANSGAGATGSPSGGAACNSGCVDLSPSARQPGAPSSPSGEPGRSSDEPSLPAGSARPAAGERSGTRPAPRPVRLSSTRDWSILVECTAGAVILYPGETRLSLSSLTLSRGNDNPLVKAVRDLAGRRQTSVRPGELPYRVQVRFLVRPDGLRSFHTAYPLLEPLGLPMARQDIDRSEEVRRP